MPPKSNHRLLWRHGPPAPARPLYCSSCSCVTSGDSPHLHFHFSFAPSSNIFRDMIQINDKYHRVEIKGSDLKVDAPQASFGPFGPPLDPLGLLWALLVFYHTILLLHVVVVVVVVVLLRVVVVVFVLLHLLLLLVVVVVVVLSLSCCRYHCHCLCHCPWCWWL